MASETVQPEIVRSTCDRCGHSEEHERIPVRYLGKPDDASWFNVQVWAVGVSPYSLSNVDRLLVCGDCHTLLDSWSKSE